MCIIFKWCHILHEELGHVKVDYQQPLGTKEIAIILFNYYWKRF